MTRRKVVLKDGKMPLNTSFDGARKGSAKKKKSKRRIYKKSRINNRKK